MNYYFYLNLLYLIIKDMEAPDQRLRKGKFTKGQISNLLEEISNSRDIILGISTGIKFLPCLT